MRNDFRLPLWKLYRSGAQILLVHGWLKFVQRRPPIVYRGEYQTLDSLLERHGADLMHIYFGHTGVHLLPFIEQWDKPCVVSFHGADVAHKEDIKDYPAKLRRLFQSGSARVCAFPITGRPIDPPGLPAGKTANQSHWYPAQ